MLTSILFYLKAFFKGELRFCQDCGQLTQCLAMGEQMRLHWQYRIPGETAELPKFPTIPEPYRSMRLCINCAFDAENGLGLHDLCCKPRMAAWRQDNGYASTEEET